MQMKHISKYWLKLQLQGPPSPGHPKPMNGLHLLFFLVKATPWPGHVGVYISQPVSWSLEVSSEAFVSLWNMVVKQPVIKPGNKATT